MTEGGRFEIEAKIAESMAITYRARDRVTGELVALKVPLGDDPAEVSAFLQEAKLAEALRHPALVRHVAHGLDPSLGPFLAVRYIEGETLAKALSRGPLPPDEVALLAGRLADGLAALHARGVVHGDVKPENVLLPHSEVADAVLIDLGLARGRDTARGARRRQGTPGFLSPEQASGGAVGPASDLFSLGALLWACLVGRSPFDHEDASRAVQRVVLADAPPVRLLRQDTPPALAQLIARLLERSPDARPSSADEVRDLALGLSSSLTPAESLRLAPRPVPIVGRDRELAFLEAVLLRGPQARVVVRGPAGVGKTSLVRAFAGKLEAAGTRALWITNRPGAYAYATLRSLVSLLVRNDETAPPPSFDELVRFFADLPASDATLLSATLSELWSAAVPGLRDPLLDLARGDPQLRGALVAQAFAALLRVTQREGPAVLVLDDAPYADTPTMRLLSRASIAIVAIARAGGPSSAMPFADQGAELLDLHELDDKAAREVVLCLLPGASEADAQAIVTRCAGLPLYLTELALSSREHPGQPMPDTLRALLVARLAERSPAEAQAIRAVALLGLRAPRAAVHHMLAGVGPAPVIDTALARLEHAGLLAHDADADSFSLRHDLVREAALETVSPRDLEELHRRALAWLLPRGEHEALLAAHAERAGLKAEAGRRYVLAAQRALEGGDLTGAARLADRALECTDVTGDKALAEACRSHALAWLGRWDEASLAGRRAVEQSRPGSLPWVLGAGAHSFACFELGNHEAQQPTLLALCDADVGDDARSALVWALGIISASFVAMPVPRGLAHRLEQRLDALLRGFDHPLATASRMRARAMVAWAIEGDFTTAIASLEACMAAYLGVGAHGSAMQSQIHLGLLHVSLGALDDATAPLLQAAETAERAGAGASAFAWLGAAEALCLAGKPEDALGHALHVASSRSLETRITVAGWTHRVLAQIHLALDDVDQAHTHVDQALSRLTAPSRERAAALLLTSTIAERRGDAAGALASARAAVALIDGPETSLIDERAARLRLASLELARGHHDEARALVDAARADLARRARSTPPHLHKTWMALGPQRELERLTRLLGG